MDTSKKRVLRIATAGSVDDGKSTLIGRLLYDTNSIATDKLSAIEERSSRLGLDYTDLSLLTDGLVAEREQGITIDVAHIYFATKNRKYIIADTPGHIEYTRNMVTGASNADVSLILVDARKGIVEQTKRHLYISHLLKVPRIIICVNKMDLIEYDQGQFESIVEDFKGLLENIGLDENKISYLPLSSLKGDNVVSKSKSALWYTGLSLLDLLESLEIKAEQTDLDARFPVQQVLRPKSSKYHDYRGYAGRVISGQFSVGDQVKVLPSGFESRITSIQKFDNELTDSSVGDSVSIQLEDDLGISRGDMLVKGDDIKIQKDLVSEICWMDEKPLSVGKTYKIQHGVNESRVKVTAINYGVNVENLVINNQLTALGLNDIGEVEMKASKPIVADTYEKNRSNGAYIFIDEFSNNTVGVGFVKRGA